MENKSAKKNLIEWALLLTAAAILYFGGWHTELIGKVQQGALFTGIFNADTEEPTPLNNPNPEADLDVKLRNQDGETISLQDLKGKVIFLNLWATWCPPCIAEMPGIDALSRDLQKEEDVVFIMISLDEKFEKAKKFKKRKDYAFDVYELVSDLPQMYYTQSIPTTFVISAEGKLVFSHKGMAEYNTQKFKEFLLKQQQ